MLAQAIASVDAQTYRPRAHLIGVDSNSLGPGRIINQLCKTVETEWVSILADDDLYDPDYLETMRAAGKDADIVLAWPRYEGRDFTPYRGEWDLERLRNRQDTGMAGTFMFRHALWQKIGWPHGIPDDWRFLTDAAVEGARFQPVYEEKWTYRWHGGNVSTVVSELAQGRVPEKLYHYARYLA
jgi:glycosyltransferase involved in cell wall biosynthesis